MKLHFVCLKLKRLLYFTFLTIFILNNLNEHIFKLRVKQVKFFLNVSQLLISLKSN